MYEDQGAIKKANLTQRICLQKLADYNELNRDLKNVLMDLEVLGGILSSNEMQNMIYEVVEAGHHLREVLSDDQSWSLCELQLATSSLRMQNQRNRNRIDSLKQQIEIEYIKQKRQLSVMGLSQITAKMIQSQKTKFCDDISELYGNKGDISQQVCGQEFNNMEKRSYDKEIIILFNEMEGLQAQIVQKQSQLKLIYQAENAEFVNELKEIHYKNTFFKTAIQEFVNLIAKQRVETKSQCTAISEEVAKLDTQQKILWCRLAKCSQ